MPNKSPIVTVGISRVHNSAVTLLVNGDKGYVKGNIQLITWKANCLKQHLDNEELIEFCKDVAQYCK